MRLNCALLLPEDDTSPVVAVVAVVDVSADATVADLLKAVHAVILHTLKSSSSSTLELYLATRTIHTSTHGRAWLPRGKLALLDASFLQQHCVRLDDPTRACDELFGLGFSPSECDADIHVLVPVTNNHTAVSDDDQSVDRPHKRARTAYSDPHTITQSRILFGECGVPLDTIEAFNAIQVALTLREHKPMVLLCGPLLTGKTTVANGIRRWIRAALDNGRLADLHECQLIDDVTMWKALGEKVLDDATCTDAASFLRVSAKQPSSLWFFMVDNLHLVLANPSLASQFLGVLHELRQLPLFGGFLGVGDHTLESLVRDSGGLFRDELVVKSQSFTDDQMRSLFQQMRHLYGFNDSLQRGLMVYSGGSPGMLGSLITFTAAEGRYSLGFDAWTRWFETIGFAKYVEDNVRMFQSLTDEWFELTQRKWWDLTKALKKRKHVSDPVPLDLRAVRDDGDGETEMEIHWKAQENDTNISDDSNGCVSRSLIDGYTQMCRRIRGWYLRIIVDCRRQAKENHATTWCIVVGNGTETAVPFVKPTTPTPP